MPRLRVAGMNHIGLDQNHRPRLDPVWPAWMVKNRTAIVHNAQGILSVRVSAITVARIDADAQLCPRDLWVAVDTVMIV